jgi:hypothetical protein
MNYTLYALPVLALMSLDIGGHHEPIIDHYDIHSRPPIVEHDEQRYTADIDIICPGIQRESFNPIGFQTPQSTNVLYKDLIIPCDPTDFLYASFVEMRNAEYIFKAHYPNDVSFEIVADSSFTYEEARDHAVNYGKAFGQIPYLLRFNFERLILRPGDGHPYSGTEIKTYTELRINAWGVKKENLVHDLAHASLNGSQGLLNRSEWEAAMRKDRYFPSLYAQNYRDPYEEDVPEFVIYYLVVRWRPERFDPRLVSFLEERFSHRFAVMDRLDWNLHN